MKTSFEMKWNNFFSTLRYYNSKLLGYFWLYLRENLVYSHLGFLPRV